MADNETNGSELLRKERAGKLKKKIKELSDIMAKQDDRLNHLQSSGFQLANFYFVFQGVILTVISNGSSSLGCSNCWIPFVLSLLAAILNLVSFVKIGLQYLRTIEQRDESLMKVDKKNAQLQKLKNPSQPREDDVPIYDDAFKRFKRTLCFVICVLLFLLFAVIMIVACWTVICRRAAESKHRRPNVNGSCIRLCDSSNCIRICSEL